MDNDVSHEIEADEEKEGFAPTVPPVSRQVSTFSSPLLERDLGTAFDAQTAQSTQHVLSLQALVLQEHAPEDSLYIKSSRAPPPSEVDTVSRKTSPAASPLLSGRPLRSAASSTMLSPSVRAPPNSFLSRRGSERNFNVLGPVRGRATSELSGGAPCLPVGNAPTKFTPHAETTTRIARPPPVVASWQWQNRQHSPCGDRLPTVLSRPASERSLKVLVNPRMGSDAITGSRSPTNSRIARSPTPLRNLSRGVSASSLGGPSESLPLGSQTPQPQGALTPGVPGDARCRAPSREPKPAAALRTQRAASRLGACSPDAKSVGMPSAASPPTVRTIVGPDAAMGTTSGAASPARPGMMTPVRAIGTASPLCERQASQPTMEPRMELSVTTASLSRAPTPSRNQACVDRQTSQPFFLANPMTECSLIASVGQLAASCESLSLTATSRTPTPARHNAAGQPPCTESQSYRPVLLARPVSERAARPLISSPSCENSAGKSRLALRPPKGHPAPDNSVRPATASVPACVVVRPTESSGSGAHTPQMPMAMTPVVVPGDSRGRWKVQESKQTSARAQKAPLRIRAVSPTAGKNPGSYEAPAALRFCPTPSRGGQRSPATRRSGG